MPTNPNFVHVAPRLSAELVARLEKRQARQGLRSLTAAVRIELSQRLAEGGDFGPVLAPPTSAKRCELWLPRELMEQVRVQAEASDASTSNMLATILAAGVGRAAALSAACDEEAAARLAVHGPQQQAAA